MKTLIAILIICCFIQSTILPIDLILIILICRSYIKPGDKANLFLGFGFGLLIAFLGLSTLGIHSLIYLFLIFITQTLSKSRLSGNLFLIIPLTFILLTLNQLIVGVLFHTPFFNFFKIFMESALSLPLLYIIKLWEERFIVQKSIKLKI